MRFGSRSRLAAALGVLGLVLVIELAAADEPFLNRLGAECLGTIAVLAIVHYIGKRPPRLPLLEYNLAYMWLFWGLPAAGFARTSNVRAPESATTIAVWLCVLAAASVCLGFSLSGSVWTSDTNNQNRVFPSELPSVSIAIFTIWLGAVAFVAAGRVLALPLSIQYIVVMLSSPWPLLTYLAMHAVRSNSMTALWLSVAVLCIAGGLGGFLGGIIKPIVGAVFLLWYLGKPFRARTILLIVGLIIVLQPAKSIYRNEVWDREDRLSKESPLAGVQRWGRALERSWLQDEGAKGKVSDTLERFDELSVIAVAVANCPGLVPRENGRIWTDNLKLMIPRVFWPSKPIAMDVTNNRFQITFGLQTEEASRSTTGAFPLPADGWWNFGWPGVAIPAVLIGLLYGYLSKAIGTHTWMRLTLAMSLMMGMHWIQDISSNLTAWIKLLLLTAVACWLILAVRMRKKPFQTVPTMTT